MTLAASASGVFAVLVDVFAALALLLIAAFVFTGYLAADHKRRRDRLVDRLRRQPHGEAIADTPAVDAADSDFATMTVGDLVREPALAEHVQRLADAKLRATARRRKA